MYPDFRANYWSKNWYLDYFEYAKFDGDFPFFCFKWGIMFLGKFGRKKYLLKLEHAKFNGAINFFSFRLEIPLMGKFRPENQNYLYKLKFRIEYNSNILNLMVMFTFSVLDRKYPFREKYQICLFKVKFGT